jgi:hypothetical protein
MEMEEDSICHKENVIRQKYLSKFFNSLIGNITVKVSLVTSNVLWKKRLLTLEQHLNIYKWLFK